MCLTKTLVLIILSYFFSLAKNGCHISMMQEFIDVLLKCVSQNVGFSHGKPIAALTIYKCLIHWKIFEAEKTSIFDRIVPVFGSAIEVT